MGLRMASPSVRLSEYKGELLALRFDDLVRNVQTQFGTVDVPRADIVRLTELKDGSVKATFEGQGLVFQKAIGQQIEGNLDWHIGTLEQVDRPTDSAPDATMYQLDQAGVDLEAVADAFARAGIRI